jgi:hypothetical protein
MGPRAFQTDPADVGHSPQVALLTTSARSSQPHRTPAIDGPDPRFRGLMRLLGHTSGCANWTDSERLHGCACPSSGGGGIRTLGRVTPSLVFAVELADGAVALPRLEPARVRTVVLLGREWHGIPEEQVEDADVCVEIPMVGRGARLNVAVAGSLVLYRLAGMV